MSLARTSTSDLKDVHNILLDPLTGRKVMIPFTSKAFVPGTLQPTTTTTNVVSENPKDCCDRTTTSSSSCDTFEESVVMKLSRDILVPMSRSEALTLLENTIMQSECSRRSTSANNNNNMNNAEVVGGPLPLQRQQQQPTLEHNNQTPRVTTTALETASASKPWNESGFFEIREEYDNDGNEICAEAINVVKELELLENGEDGKREQSLSMFQECLSVPIPSLTTSNERNADSGNSDVNQATQESKALTDHEFEMLSLRLEELARLEDADEGEKIVNRKSATIIQGSGWKKGFLNRPPSNSFKRSDTHNSGESVSKPIPTKAPRSKKVEFNTVTDVCEIPLRVRNNHDETSSCVPKSPSTTAEPQRQLISDQVFSGVVTERPVTKVVLGQERQSITHISSSGTAAPVRKKMSRFAQQRLEQQEQFAKERDQNTR